MKETRLTLQRWRVWVVVVRSGTVNGGVLMIDASVVETAAAMPVVTTQAIRWYPSSWANRVTLLATELTALARRCEPDAQKPGARLVTRQDVFDIFGDQETSARERFTAAMVWGYGTVGRGPARVEHMIERAGDALDARLEQMIDAAAGDPGHAWDVGLRDAKLAYLGPSFATKILYFAAFAEAAPWRPAPLIADAVVARALGLHKFTRDAYIAYCTEAAHASRALDGSRCRADQIEYALFARGKAL